jgi:hypothetical protein
MLSKFALTESSGSHSPAFTSSPRMSRSRWRTRCGSDAGTGMRRDWASPRRPRLVACRARRWGQRSWPAQSCLPEEQSSCSVVAVSPIVPRLLPQTPKDSDGDRRHCSPVENRLACFYGRHTPLRVGPEAGPLCFSFSGAGLLTSRPGSRTSPTRDPLSASRARCRNSSGRACVCSTTTR